MTHAAQAGKSFPLGATVGDSGVNFSLFSRTATGVELLFFDRDDDAMPSRVVQFDSVTNPHVSLLAHVRARCFARTTLRFSSRGTGLTETRAAV